jgi:hypothetical protein
MQLQWVLAEHAALVQIVQELAVAAMEAKVEVLVYLN